MADNRPPGVTTELQMFLDRAPVEEGVRRFAYNDATGKQVTCRPAGNLSIAEGINLENGLDAWEIGALTTHRAQLVEQDLQQYPWYVDRQAVWRSVLIDIGYNLGLGGLLHFPSMIHYLQEGNYPAAIQQCSVADPKIDAQRYAPLRALLVGQT